VYLNKKWTNQKAIKQITNHISYYIPTTICFSNKGPFSQGLLKTNDPMPTMYFRCQLQFLSLKIFKCYNSKLQMLTITAHIAVITTYINRPLMLLKSHLFIFFTCVYKHLRHYMIQCDLIQLRPYLVSGYIVYCCCICF
jgi:hypothetical protein